MSKQHLSDLGWKALHDAATAAEQDAEMRATAGSRNVVLAGDLERQRKQAAQSVLAEEKRKKIIRSLEDYLIKNPKHEGMTAEQIKEWNEQKRVIDKMKAEDSDYEDDFLEEAAVEARPPTPPPPPKPPTPLPDDLGYKFNRKYKDKMAKPTRPSRGPIHDQHATRVPEGHQYPYNYMPDDANRPRYLIAVPVSNFHKPKIPHAHMETQYSNTDFAPPPQIAPENQATPVSDSKRPSKVSLHSQGGSLSQAQIASLMESSSKRPSQVSLKTQVQPASIAAGSKRASRASLNTQGQQSQAANTAGPGRGSRASLDRNRP